MTLAIQMLQQSLTRWVKLGGSEGEEAVVDEWLSQMVLQVLKWALASHNGLQHSTMLNGSHVALIKFVHTFMHQGRFICSVACES